MPPLDHELTPEQRQAQERLHALISELASLLGPGSFDDEDSAPADANVVLAEWVLMASWMDVNDGSHYLTRVGSPSLPIHHRGGLLHEGLYGFD